MRQAPQHRFRSNWRRKAGRSAGVLTIVGVMLVPATAAQAGLLSGLTGTVVGVVSTALDTTSGLLTGADWGYAASQTSMSQVEQTIGANTLWSSGDQGQGVGVALIDSGVVPVQGLKSGNVVNGPDLSFESQASNLAHLDAFGHGTHMAGIIAGNDGGLLPQFQGVAPRAKLVSVRVGTSDGAVDVSQVVAAVDWVVEHRADNGLNIRVINLSYGTDGNQNYQVDPLTTAIENAWRHGIVVVVAGGNLGTNQPYLNEPADDPYTIAVGAADTSSGGTAATATIPAFSSRGSAGRHVDLVAPGQSIVSLRDPNSYIDTQYPAARVNTRFFKGSGTSEAAAVTSGAVALLLAAHPSLTPDQAKALLMDSAQPIPGASAADQGAGLLDVGGASLLPAPATTQTWPQAGGSGSLQLARGTHVLSNNGVALTGEQDIFGHAWQPSVWAPLSAKGDAWNGGVWNGNTWIGGCWCSTTWSGTSWPTVAWTSSSWSSSSWSSSSWSSSSWSSSSWSSSSWSSSSWSGSYWA